MLERERESRLSRGTKPFMFKAEENLINIQNFFCVYCKKADIYMPNQQKRWKKLKNGVWNRYQKSHSYR